MVKINKFEKDGKSYPTIELTDGKPAKAGARPKFGFTFGLSKARLILENYEAIRQFVQDNAPVEAGE